MPRRVLLLCYHFHPSSEVGAKRANALAEHLAATGSSPVIVSAFAGRKAEDLATSTAVRFADSELVPVPDSRRRFLDMLVRLKSSLSRSRAAAPVSPIEISAKSPAEPGGLREIFFAVLYGIDEKKGWALRASRLAASAAKRHHSEVIFASGPPFSPLAGAILAGRRAKVPVVVDFRDPCFYPLPAHKHPWAARLSSTLKMWFEAWVIRHANAIVCTAPSLAELLRIRYPEAADRIHFIPNGFDGEPERPISTKGLLHIVFAGELYLNRNPFLFLDSVSALLNEDGVDASRVRVTFVGQCDSYAGTDLRTWLAEKPAGKVARILPKVGPEELKNLYAEATVLLNLAQGQPMQIPAKTFEQLASGKELLLVCEAESDTARLMRSVPGVHRVSGDDASGMLDVLRVLYADHVRAGVTRAPDLERVSQFSRLEQNRKLVELLDGCIAQYHKE